MTFSSLLILRFLKSYIQENPQKPANDFAVETLQARRDWPDTFQVLEERWLFYLERLLLKIRDSFSGEQKLKEVVTTKLALQEMVKGCH